MENKAKLLPCIKSYRLLCNRIKVIDNFSVENQTCRKMLFKKKSILSINVLNKINIIDK